MRHHRASSEGNHPSETLYTAVLYHRAYYALKPFIPWSWRMSFRRAIARRQRRLYENVWPIDEVASHPPREWQGWPDGRQFAFLISHDVEGPAGLENCRRLAEIEMELGFRSCFNFVPEGTYTVPPSLRSWLVERGFEVGVHDLHHDGKLYHSAHRFTHHARRINDYLRSWDARGFRSAYMLRNLDWIHELGIEYDSSTFDTDPFEPQSDGVRTIFPFWVCGARRNACGFSDVLPFTAPVNGSKSSPHGYVELPYTLVQDSTLFLVLGERSADIWRRKLDWIATHGGMAFVNVHPDYVGFGAGPESPHTYPLQHYVDLLAHVRRHDPKVWHALPRDVARHFGTMHRKATSNPDSGAASLPTANLRGKHAAVLLYSNYPADPRPRRAAETMVAAGMNVEVLCLSERPEEPRREIVNGIEVFRVPMRRRRDGRLRYVWQYSRFIASSCWFLVRRGFATRYDLVHVHNMPDVLVFAALPAKLRGAKVILDLHDPMPELMMAIYGANPDSFAITLLRRIEGWSIRFADKVLTVNEACRKIFTARSCSHEKVQVVMNTPDERIFPLRDARFPGRIAPGSDRRRFVFMYHGSLVPRHGLDLAVQAVETLRRSFPNLELRVYGQHTDYLATVLRDVEDRNLRDTVRYFGPQTLDGIVTAIRECDAGVVPNRRSIFTEINTPTRIFEYLSQGKPVVTPRAPGVEDYFGPDDLYYFELGNLDDLTRQMARVITAADCGRSVAERGQRVYLHHTWTSEQKRFRDTLTEVLGPAATTQTHVLDSQPLASKVT